MNYKCSEFQQADQNSKLNPSSASYSFFYLGLLINRLGRLLPVLTLDWRAVEISLSFGEVY